MSATTAISVEEYLRTCYRPDREYLEGTILERNVGEYSHARVQTKIIWACVGNESAWRVRALTGQRVQVSRERYRVPDCCLQRADAPLEEVVETPPLLCVEILSPDDRMTEMQERIDDYLAMGVPFVWLINPLRRRAWLHTASNASELRDALRVPGTPIEISLDWLFEDLPPR